MKTIFFLRKALILLLVLNSTILFAQTTVPANTIEAINSTTQTTLDGVARTYKGTLNNLKIDNETSVKLTSGSIVIVGYVPASLQFNYTSNIGANKPYYFRLSDASSFTNTLLGGAIGGFLDGVLFGTHFISVTPLLNGTVVPGGGRTDDYWTQTGTNHLSVMQDGLNKKYIRIVPTSEYNQIRFVDNTAGGVLSTNSSEINYAYYYQNQTSCDVPLMTSYTGSGGVLSVGAQNPVTDAYKSIDSDPTSFTSIGGNKLLDVALSSTVEQFFYLPQASRNKMISFKMSIPSGLLNVNVADQSKIVFYKGNEVKGELPINANLLGLDLAGLINANNQPFIFMVVPPPDLVVDPTGGTFIEYDKVSIKIIKPVNVNLLGGASLRIFDVVLANIKPEIKKVCTKEFINNNIRETKFDITQIIPNYSASTQYLIVDKLQNEIPFATVQQREANKWQPLGTYYVKGVIATGYCQKEYIGFAAEQNKQYKITGSSSVSIPLDANNDGVSDASVLLSQLPYTSDLPNNTGVRFYDELTNVDVTNQVLPFSAIGSYNYYAKSVNAANTANVTCDVVKRITVYVYGKDECDYRYVQTIANKSVSGSLITGGTSETARAADNDLSTHATIFNVLSLAGVGSAWIDLSFVDTTNSDAPVTISSGTPITIKLGQEYSLLQLIGGITVQTLDATGNPSGPLLNIGELDLLNVLVGDNVFEFSFVPKNVNGQPISYRGVRVIQGGVLGLATSAKVFGAYVDIRKPLNQAGTCQTNIKVHGAEIAGNLDASLSLNTSTEDVLYGVQDAGLGVATALSGVLYSYLAADAIDDTVNVNNPLNGKPNFNTAAIFNTAASVLNRQTLTVKFKEIARPGDKVRIVMSAQGAPILDLNLLSNFSIQRYLGNIPIGDQITNNDFQIIKLDLLNLIADQGTNKYALIINGIGASFDRVELRMDNVASVNLLGDKTYIYDVSVVPNFEYNENNNLFCTSSPLEIEKLDLCSTYSISFAYATLSPTINPATNKRDILAWNDIPNSTINEIGPQDPRYNQNSHKFQLNKLYSQYSSNDNLYLKVVSKRQGCIYGDAQYFKIKIKNCSTISNPMIRTRLKSN